MESIASIPPLVVVAGQTASGKSAFAIELAKRFNGEIICADSRTVYKGMDIGTAKPTTHERRAVPHHLLDITTPDKPITAAEFKQFVQQSIQDITSRGRLPLLVGGTGLYIDAVIFDFSFRPAPDLVQRQKLLNCSVEELQQILFDMGVALPQNERNPRHLVRQIETGGLKGQKSNLRKNTLIFALELEKEELTARIAARLDNMLGRGLEEEVRRLVTRYGWDCRALQTIGYQEFRPYFGGSCSLAEVKVSILRNSLHYAKRQKTWFKRNPHIHWICKLDEPVDLITTLLNKSRIAE